MHPPCRIKQSIDVHTRSRNTSPPSRSGAVVAGAALLFRYLTVLSTAIPQGPTGRAAAHRATGSRRTEGQGLESGLGSAKFSSSDNPTWPWPSSLGHGSFKRRAEEDRGAERTGRATPPTPIIIFVPEGKLAHFEKYVEDYLAERKTPKGDALDHQELLDTIGNPHRAEFMPGPTIQRCLPARLG